MRLSESIKKAFNVVGAQCFNSTLPNIVSDYYGYEEAPAAKQVLKEFVAQGYGSKVLDIYTTELPWQQKMQLWASEFASKTGYKEELVNYVFECVEYGLGWIQKEPIYNVTGSAKKDYAEDLTGVDLDKQLVLMQKEYISMLNSLIVVPEGKIYKKSGYYPAQAIADLWVVEHKIGILSAALGKDNSNWCKTEKEKVLKQYERSKSSQFGAVLVKVITPAIIALIVLSSGVGYLLSRGEINQFNTAIAQGEEAASKGDYQEAMSLFAKAANEYDGSFGKASKKNTAGQKFMEAATLFYDNTIISVNELTRQGHYFDAKQLLQDLEKYPFDKDLRTRLKTAQQDLDSIIERAITDGKNTMLVSISTNGRKLDPSTMEILQELLKVAPDDYWLNFIMNKSK